MTYLLTGHNNFQAKRDSLVRELLKRSPTDRGSWQSGASPSPVYELEDVVLMNRVPPLSLDWASETSADMPWAELHFEERISGQPLNPAPSYLEWPWHSEKYKEAHKAKWSNRHDRQAPFDHTYPERMWPKLAGGNPEWADPMAGIRFDYGDLQDVIDLLKRDRFTRQAYLPIWFPEDTGSTEGQRVPCTLGYHFIRQGPYLNMKYFLRSCDITRHFHNDVYMAGRLLQYVVSQLLTTEKGGIAVPWVGNLTMFISNLHMFTADEWRYEGVQK